MSKSIKLFDLESQQKKIQKDIKKRINKVFDHGQYIKGPEVFELEKLLSNYVGVKHCITCGNGTDAIMISLMALGIEPGDEILVPSFTYAASAEPIAILGATPVFVEIDENSFNLDIKDAEHRLTSKTKGIIATSLYGQCADFVSINKFAKKNDLFVLEDGAQSFGAEISNHKSCSFTDLATTSFFPTKPLGCYGDGGAIFTNNEELAILVSQISTHGQSEKYKHIRLGLNSRLDTIQAAILLEKFVILEDEINIKNEIAKRYESLIKNSLITKPLIEEKNKSVYALYTIKTDYRDRLKELLIKENIPFGIYYQIPLHKQRAFENSISSNLSLSEKICEQVLSLPLHPYLSRDSQEKIIEVLNNVK